MHCGVRDRSNAVGVVGELCEGTEWSAQIRRAPQEFGAGGRILDPHGDPQSTERREKEGIVKSKTSGVHVAVSAGGSAPPPGWGPHHPHSLRQALLKPSLAANHDALA